MFSYWRLGMLSRQRLRSIISEFRRQHFEDVLENLGNGLSVNLGSDKLNAIGWGRSVYEQTRRRFIMHFKKYLTEHSNDWSTLESEHENLIGLAIQLQQLRDYKNLLSVRDDLQPYLDFRGYWPESIALSEWAINAAQVTGDQQTVARFTHDRANILHQSGDYAQAEQLYKDSEDSYRSIDNIEMALHSRHMRSLVVRARGQLDDADQLCQTTIEEAQSIGLSTWLAHPFYVKGLIARDRGNFSEARGYVEKSLELFSETEEKAVIAQCHHFLGELSLMTGQFDSAHRNLELSLQLSREVGILRRVAATTRLIGDLARVERKYDEADQFYSEAIEISTSIGDRPELAKVLLSKGKLLICQRKEQQAINLFEKANLIYAEIGDPRGKILVLYYLFRLYGKQGGFLKAANLLIEASRLTWDAGLYKPRYLIQLIQRGVK
jgi:tetratricopeptide (TPR) repeat protein